MDFFVDLTSTAEILKWQVIHTPQINTAVVMICSLSSDNPIKEIALRAELKQAKAQN